MRLSVSECVCVCVCHAGGDERLKQRYGIIIQFRPRVVVVVVVVV
jgi:hypothetical protein